jgi:hypothetical protein
MLKDTFCAPSKRMDSSFGNMNTRDTEVDRIHWLISRQGSIYLKDPWLCKTIGIVPSDITSYLSASRIMERIGDHSVTISKNLMKLNSDGKISNMDAFIENTGTKLKTLFEKSMGSWIKTDMASAECCIETGNEIVAEIKNSMEDIIVERKTASPINIIVSSSRRIAEYCIDISEQTLNNAMN